MFETIEIIWKKKKIIRIFIQNTCHGFVFCFIIVFTLVNEPKKIIIIKNICYFIGWKEKILSKNVFWKKKKSKLVKYKICSRILLIYIYIYNYYDLSRKYLKKSKEFKPNLIIITVNCCFELFSRLRLKAIK